MVAETFGAVNEGLTSNGESVGVDKIGLRAIRSGGRLVYLHLQ